MKQHILVISQYFYPEEFRINDICKEWIKRGYEVTVVTGIPNYPRGKFYKGYGWLRRRQEKYEGINIVRLPIIPRGKKPVMLILNYLSFVVSGFFWKIFTGRKADKVFIFEVSPMTQALTGVWYARKHKVPCFIYVQDLWPENVEFATGIHNKRLISAIDKMVDYIYRNCTGIFATSPGFVKKIEERESAWNENSSKVLYWPQYAEEFYCPVKKSNLQDLPMESRFKIAFTGNIGYAQGLDILPRAAVLLKKKHVECTFIIIGDGRYMEEFNREIVQNSVGDMFFLLGRKKPEEIPAYLAWCDVAFISFADNPLFERTIPAKLQSYMACGKPILAAATGETRRIINEAECGKACGLGDEEALAQAVDELTRETPENMRRMSENAMHYCQNFFEKKKLLDEMERYLTEG